MDTLFAAQALTCYCIGQYCKSPPEPIPTYDDENYENSISNVDGYSSSQRKESRSQFSSCEAKKDAKCYSAVTQIEDISTGELKPFR